MSRIRFPLFLLFSASALLVAAGEPTWAGKAISQWTEADAQQILADSPWSRIAAPRLLPYLSEQARRDSGDMIAEGGGKGVGFHGGFNPFGANEGMTSKDPLFPKALIVRWESAFPVQAAEKKLHDSTAPELAGENYAIAIRDVPLRDALANITMRTLAGRLKINAYLRREGKKDLKPLRVSVLADETQTATLVYLFPREARIGPRDQSVLFVAVVGRLFLAQYFFPPQMQIQGELAL